MAEWLERREETDNLFERSDELEEKAIAKEIESAAVVCTTNSTAGSDIISDQQFDTLVIDEATQATEPSCLIPITHADRVVMAGDHRQLPPTVQNEEAAHEGLREILFERLAEAYDGIRSLLRVQYRMHESIQDFSAERFYNGELSPDESVSGHTLRDLGIDPEDRPSRRSILDPGEPLTFVNTAAIEAPERQRLDSTSRENPQEAEMVARLGADYLDRGIDPAEIALISPYVDQTDRIEDELNETLGGTPEEVEIDTIDGFQGREKEIVIVSLVRSNPRDDIGFLDDARRFNVALTRARRKAVVVGDADTDTVTAGDVFENLITYIREHDAEVSFRKPSMLFLCLPGYPTHSALLVGVWIGQHGHSP